MKVILLKDVKKQGKAGEIKEFADGFAQFLIKKGDATLLTQGSMNRLQKEKKEEILKENQQIQEANQLKEELEKITIQIKVRTGKMDKMFGSVSSKQVSSELEKLGYKIDKRKIVLDHEITCLGFHTVQVILHKKVIANVKIEVVKE